MKPTVPTEAPTMRGLTLLTTALLPIILSACTSTPDVKWISSQTTDEFTDQQSCMVTAGSYYTASGVYTKSFHYYPFIENAEGEIRVGVRSGGKYPIPVGDVQLRIDSNPAWDITTSETPLTQRPATDLGAMQSYTSTLPPEQQALIKNSYITAMESSGKAISPYTATTGEKALKIIRDMANGRLIKYRTVGFNQVTSTTGEYELDESLKAALSSCNIPY